MDLGLRVQWLKHCPEYFTRWRGNRRSKEVIHFFDLCSQQESNAVEITIEIFNEVIQNGKEN